MSDLNRPSTGHGNRRGRSTSVPRQRPHSVHGKSSRTKRKTLKVRQYRPDFPGGKVDIETSKPQFIVRPKVLNYSRWVDERQRLGRIRDRSSKYYQNSSSSSSSTASQSRNTNTYSRPSTSSSSKTKSNSRTGSSVGGEKGEVVLDRVNMERANLREIPQLGTEHKSLKLLNIQFNHITKITNLRFFPELIFLDLYQNQVRRLGGLDCVPRLRALMMGRNQVQKIEGLDHLPHLDVLDLHQNRISRIEGLESLGELRVLNLAGNRIKRIERVSGLRSLVELNLKKNRIESLGNVTQSYFERNTPHLQRVFLSKNRIRKFSSIQSLLKGCTLTEFSLDGNPIANHPLYRNYLIEHVTTLRKIDFRKVTDDERRIVFQKRGRQSSTITNKSSSARSSPYSSSSSHLRKVKSNGSQSETTPRISHFFKSSKIHNKHQQKQEIIEDGDDHDDDDDHEQENNNNNNNIRASSVTIVKKKVTTTARVTSPLKPFEVKETLKRKCLVIKSILTDIEESEYYQIVETVEFRNISFREAADTYLVKLRKFGKLYHLKLDDNKIHFLEQLHRLSIIGDRITHLTLTNNPIESLPFPTLRDYCIIIMPRLRVLNGEKVYEIGSEKAMRRNMFDRLDRFEKKFEILGGIGGRRGVAGGKPMERDWHVDMYKEDAKVYLQNVLEHSMTIYKKMRIIDRQWDSVIEKIIKQTIQKM